MIKRLLTVILAGIMLAGCVDSSLSGDVYSASQAKQIQTVRYGTLVSARPVQIQGDDESHSIVTLGAGLLGGFIGNTIGGGLAQGIATTAGALIGLFVGDRLDNAANRGNAVELEITTDNRENIVVVQKAGETKFNPGQRVRMTQSRDAGGNAIITVSPL